MSCLALVFWVKEHGTNPPPKPTWQSCGLPEVPYPLDRFLGDFPEDYFGPLQAKTLNMVIDDLEADGYLAKTDENRSKYCVVDASRRCDGSTTFGLRANGMEVYLVTWTTLGSFSPNLLFPLFGCLVLLTPREITEIWSSADFVNTCPGSGFTLSMPGHVQISASPINRRNAYVTCSCWTGCRWLNQVQGLGRTCKPHGPLECQCALLGS